MSAAIPLAEVPEAATEAAKFAVPPEIHAEDFLFQHHLALWRDRFGSDARAQTTYYFMDGARSAAWMDSLVREHHPEAAARRLALLEFASGYGCVSRHLRRMAERYDLTGCDIHPPAIDFLEGPLGVPALKSHVDPRAFSAGRRFDVVFALSFFSHMPHRTFAAWLRALFATLADDGLLIFTTHGRNGYTAVGHPGLSPAGYWFAEMSEQKDLSTADYGCMIATPFYVIDLIAGLPCAALLQFREAYWWGTQDLYVVRKVATDFRPHPGAALHAEFERMRQDQAALAQQLDDERRAHALARRGADELEEAVRVIRASTSWRVTAPLRALRGLIGG